MGATSQLCYIVGAGDEGGVEVADEPLASGAGGARDRTGDCGKLAPENVGVACSERSSKGNAPKSPGRRPRRGTNRISECRRHQLTVESLEGTPDIPTAYPEGMQDWIAAAGVRRLDLDGTHTTIPREAMNDSRLSLEAKGLYALLLSHQGQPINPCEDAIEDLSVIEAAIDELIGAGYVVRVSS